MMLIDLDELDRVFQGRLLWSTKGMNASWLRRADYLGDARESIKSEVHALVARKLGFASAGPVRMLTHLRTWGYCFNPVTFYYCYAEDGSSLEAIVAEITNTPWKERHAYALDVRGKHPATTTHTFAKDFHVSPFMPMQQTYAWRLGAPSQHLFVHMKNYSAGNQSAEASEATHMFDATLALRRTEISSAALSRVLFTYPFITLKVVAGIYWHALRLRLKGTPFHAHPQGSPKAIS
jgi:DUF1365 family protein